MQVYDVITVDPTDDVDARELSPDIAEAIRQDYRDEFEAFIDGVSE